MNSDLRAAAVGDLAEILQLAQREAARKLLTIELLVDGDLDFELFGQSVDDRHADAVQSARSLIGAGIEFAARVQNGHHHFQRGLALDLGVHADGNAASIVDDGEPAALLHRDGDESRVSGDRLVHGIVEHLGEEVVHRGFVRAADIHAGTPPHRLQPFEHLDGVGVVFDRSRAFGGFGGGRADALARLGRRRASPE